MKFKKGDRVKCHCHIECSATGIIESLYVGESYLVKWGSKTPLDTAWEWDLTLIAEKSNHPQTNIFK